MTQAVPVGPCGQALLADRLLNKDTACQRGGARRVGSARAAAAGYLTLEQHVCLGLEHVRRKSDTDLPDEFAGQLREAPLPAGPS